MLFPRAGGPGSRSLPFLALVALAPLAAGCAVRTDFIPSNGQPLRVIDEVRVVKVTDQVKVGESRDARGNVTEHFAERSGAVPVRYVAGAQGATEVDDESYYLIARDTDATAKYAEHHAAGKRMSILGIGITAVSTALVGGGIGLLTSSATEGDPEPCKNCDGGINRPLNNLGYLSIAGIVVGALGIIAGGNIWIRGAAQARETDARLFPINETARRMKDDANVYNSGIKGATR